MTRTLKWAGIFFAVFLLFSIPVALGVFAGLDRSITVFLQGIFSSAFDTPLSFFSLLGSFELTTLILASVLIKLGFRKSFLILIVFFLGIGLELLGKIFLYHPGPPPLFFRYNLGFYFPSGIIQTGHSYPSGHSYRTAFLTLLLLYLLFSAKKIKLSVKKWLSVALLVILVIMLLSRISLGEHWTTDVIGGLLLGASLASSSLYLIQAGKKPLHKVK